MSKWQTKKLGEICEIELGKTPFRKNYKFWDVKKETGNIWLSIADLLNTEGNTIFDSKEYISDAGAKLCKVVKKGTLLASFKLTLGRLAFVGKDLYTNEAIAALTIKNREELSEEYLYHFLTHFDWHGEVRGDIKIKGKTLNKAKLKEIIISFPPLPEQKRIVKILDEVFENIAKAREIAEKNFQNSKELFESYLQGVFAPPSLKLRTGKESSGKDWEDKKLGDIGKVSMCKRIFKEQTLTNGDIPFYKIGTFGKKPNAYISNKIYNEYRNKFSFPKKGDILLSASGTIGRRVEYDGEPAYFQDSNIVWIDNDEKQVLNEYLYHFYGTCKWNTTKGATIARLYNDNLKQVRIVFPKSLNEQKFIVSRLDTFSAETKKLEGIYRQKLADLEELKKSVLKKAFDGKL